MYSFVMITFWNPNCFKIEWQTYKCLEWHVFCESDIDKLKATLINCFSRYLTHCMVRGGFASVYPWVISSVIPFMYIPHFDLPTVSVAEVIFLKSAPQLQTTEVQEVSWGATFNMFKLCLSFLNNLFDMREKVNWALDL